MKPFLHNFLEKEYKIKKELEMFSRRVVETERKSSKWMHWGNEVDKFNNLSDSKVTESKENKSEDPQDDVQSGSGNKTIRVMDSNLNTSMDIKTLAKAMAKRAAA